MLPTLLLVSIDSGVALQADGASFSPEGIRETETYALLGTNVIRHVLDWSEIIAALW